LQLKVVVFSKQSTAVLSIKDKHGCKFLALRFNSALQFWAAGYLQRR
jgi:hypothetical protein